MWPAERRASILGRNETFTPKYKALALATPASAGFAHMAMPVHMLKSDVRASAPVFKEQDRKWSHLFERVAKPLGTATNVVDDLKAFTKNSVQLYGVDVEALGNSISMLDTFMKEVKPLVNTANDPSVNSKIRAFANIVLQRVWPEVTEPLKKAALTFVLSRIAVKITLGHVSTLLIVYDTLKRLEPYIFRTQILKDADVINVLKGVVSRYVLHRLPQPKSRGTWISSNDMPDDWNVAQDGLAEETMQIVNAVVDIIEELQQMTDEDLLHWMPE